MLKENMQPAYLSKRQLAVYLGVTERSIVNFMKRGLPHYRIGNKLLRFNRQDAEQWMKRFRVDEKKNDVDRIIEEILE
jgi:excisionase family DNA binding protein